MIDHLHQALRRNVETVIESLMDNAGKGIKRTCQAMFLAVSRLTHVSSRTRQTPGLEPGTGE